MPRKGDFRVRSHAGIPCSASRASEGASATASKCAEDQESRHQSYAHDLAGEQIQHGGHLKRPNDEFIQPSSSSTQAHVTVLRGPTRRLTVTYSRNCSVTAQVAVSKMIKVINRKGPGAALRRISSPRGRLIRGDARQCPETMAAYPEGWAADGAYAVACCPGIIEKLKTAGWHAGPPYAQPASGAK